jgi:hypothetical protein
MTAMFSVIVSVVSWIGIATFLWSVADSLAKIASAMNYDSSSTPNSTSNQPGVA